MSRSWRTAVRGAFCVVGALFLAVAFERTWRDAHAHVLPSARSLAAGGAAIAVALWCTASGWAALFERADLDRSLAYSFVLSQLGKYIPGGVWQFVGQVGLATDAGAALARTSAVVPVHIVVQTAAGGSIGALAGILAPSVPIAWRVVALAGAGAVVFLDRRVLLAVVTRLGSRVGVTGGMPIDLPSQPAIWRAYLWTVGALLASGAAFALMLSSVAPASRAAATVVVFALAWLGGFLAVLVPAGLGVREAVLMAFLPASAGAIVAVSLCHRILAMAVEWTALAIARAYPR